jgi:hypothetical protein
MPGCVLGAGQRTRGLVVQAVYRVLVRARDEVTLRVDRNLYRPVAELIPHARERLVLRDEE